MQRPDLPQGGQTRSFGLRRLQRQRRGINPAAEEEHVAEEEFPRPAQQKLAVRGVQRQPRLLTHLPQGSGEPVLPRERAAAGTLPETGQALARCAAGDEIVPRRIPDPDVYAQVLFPRGQRVAPPVQGAGFPACVVVYIPELVLAAGAPAERRAVLGPFSGRLFVHVSHRLFLGYNGIS